MQNVAAFPFNPPRGLEFLSRTNLVLDLGKLVYDQPNRSMCSSASSTG